MRSFMFLFLLSLVFGCSSATSPQKKNVARINLHEEPNSLDPRKARSLNSLNVVRALFEGLTRIGPNEKAELALAERVRFSDDFKRCTVYLRNAQWSNHAPVTAHDFVYTWKKLLDPQFLSDMASYLYVIKNARAVKEGKLSVDELGVKALDQKTLELEMEYPTPYLLELLTLPPFFAVNAQIDQSNPHWAENPSSFVSNGPFVLDAWKHEDHILVAKNASYWDAQAVQLDTVELVMVPEETELKMFEQKELDWAGSPLSIISLEAIQALKKKGTLKAKEMLGTAFIRVNTECPPLHHPAIRKALSFSIHRREIVDHVLQGNQLPATGLVPPCFRLQHHAYFSDGADQEARHLFTEGLTALKLPRESFPELKLTYAANERNHLIAQAVQQQWRKALDVEIKLEAVESKIFFERISRQDFQLAIGSWIADFNDPINFLDVFRYKTGRLNNTHWENAQYAELLQLSETEGDAVKRFDLLARSEKILIEEMPILPIFHFAMLYVQQPHLKDVVLSSLGSIDLKWAKTTEGDKR